MRSGAIKVICAACGARMMPNVADWIECASCDKPMTADDRIEVDLRNSDPEGWQLSLQGYNVTTFEHN